jgi:hypothetical protein
VEVLTPSFGKPCRFWLQQWVEPAHADAEARAAWLRSAAGPLSNDVLALHELGMRVVVNLQLVRYPATIRPDLGGHAEYLLRAFRPGERGVLAPEPLENTIDPKLFGAGARQQELVKWLGEHSADVDAGTPLLPASFLATRSLSVTPRGLSRLANRPFTTALPPKLLEGLDLAAGKLVKSPQGLLRRLDQLSCQGCHEARSVAGFHLLGEDAADAPVENSLALPVSPHLLADLPRRLRIARQILAGREPDMSAPLPERPGADAGGYGSHCGLGSDPSFADWKCAPGLVCSGIEAAPGDPVGQCLPAEREVGDACESGSVKPKADRRYDRMGAVEAEECPGMVCNRSSVGFPAGMCTARCGAPGAVCGPIAVLDSFNACLARGESFLTCILGNVNPAGLRGCDESHACRDDYICARGQDGGVCLPPYFVFQLCVDGH